MEICSYFHINLTNCKTPFISSNNLNLKKRGYLNCTQRSMSENKIKMAKKKEEADWPIIKPKHNLQINRLKDTDLFTVNSFFSPSESKTFVKVAESIGFVHQGSLGPAKGEAYRDNDRMSVNDPILAEAIWASGLNKLFSGMKIRGRVAVGLNSNIRFYRYQAGHQFGRHIDESVILDEEQRTHYTLLIYLTGGPISKGTSDFNSHQDSCLGPLVGGETVFYGSRNRVVAKVAPTEGMALLHIHGEKCMLHEARNVIKGVKFIEKGIYLTGTTER